MHHHLSSRPSRNMRVALVFVFFARINGGDVADHLVDSVRLVAGVTDGISRAAAHLEALWVEAKGARLTAARATAGVEGSDHGSLNFGGAAVPGPTLTKEALDRTVVAARRGAGEAIRATEYLEQAVDFLEQAIQVEIKMMDV